MKPKKKALDNIAELYSQVHSGCPMFDGAILFLEY